MNKNKEWICLDKKINNSELKGKYKCMSWPVKNNKNYYTKFRVKMTDTDSDGEYYFSCSGLEIYGNIKISEVKWVLLIENSNCYCC